MDLLNSLTVVTISYGIKTHRAFPPLQFVSGMFPTEVQGKENAVNKKRCLEFLVDICFLAEMLAVYEHVTMPSPPFSKTTAAKLKMDLE